MSTKEKGIIFVLAGLIVFALGMLSVAATPVISGWRPVVANFPAIGLLAALYGATKTAAGILS